MAVLRLFANPTQLSDFFCCFIRRQFNSEVQQVVELSCLG